MRQKESEYEESIEAYKEMPIYRFVRKWDKRRQVRQKKKTLQKANRSLRLHYYVRLSAPNNKVLTTISAYQESTSDASDTSSVTAVSGSPPRSRRAYSDEEDKRITSWAEDVANSDSANDPDSDCRGVVPPDPVRPSRVSSASRCSSCLFRGRLPGGSAQKLNSFSVVRCSMVT